MQTCFSALFSKMGNYSPSLTLQSYYNFKLGADQKNYKRESQGEKPGKKKHRPDILFFCFIRMYLVFIKKYFHFSEIYPIHLYLKTHYFFHPSTITLSHLEKQKKEVREGKKKKIEDVAKAQCPRTDTTQL